jgi:hypothetical protein
MHNAVHPYGPHGSKGADTRLATPDIISQVRYDGVAPNVRFVKVAIVIPAEISRPVYGDIVVEVKCFSRVRFGYHFRGLQDIRAKNTAQAAQLAGVIAGAMAENLCAQYGDQIDPAEYAKEAMAAFHDALKRFNDQQPTPVPPDQTLIAIVQGLRALQELDR